MTGEIPAELAQTGSPACLDLAYNSLTGQIPVELEGLELRQLYLEGNGFSGRIPEGLWKTARHDLEELLLPVGKRTNATG